MATARRRCKQAESSMRAGGMGLMSGRNAFQKPMKEGAGLLSTIQDVFLEPEISVA